MSRTASPSIPCDRDPSSSAPEERLNEARARLAYLVDGARGVGFVCGTTAADGAALAAWAVETFASQGHEVACVSARDAQQGRFIDALAQGLHLAVAPSQPAWRAWQAVRQHLEQHVGCRRTTVVIALGVSGADQSWIADMLQLAHLGTELETHLTLILVCQPGHGSDVRQSFGNRVALEIRLGTSDV